MKTPRQSEKLVVRENRGVINTGSIGGDVHTTNISQGQIDGLSQIARHLEMLEDAIKQHAAQVHDSDVLLRQVQAARDQLESPTRSVSVVKDSLAAIAKVAGAIPGIAEIIKATLTVIRGAAG